MATIRKRSGKWQVQVRRAGARPITKTFSVFAEARTWARQQEASRPQPSFHGRASEFRAMTVWTLLDRYAREISPLKRSGAAEQIRIKAMGRDPLAAVSLTKLRSSDIAAYRDRRLQTVCGETVRRDLSLFHHLFEVARREWGLPIFENPVHSVRKPPASPGRERRLTRDDLERLKRGFLGCRKAMLRHVVGFAIETGMRRSEILALCWRDIDLDRGLAHIRFSKTGYSRVAPLTERARAILHGMGPGAPTEPVFRTTWKAVELSWRRLVRRAGIVDLHFHDLRHEAISRFFEYGLNVPQVALISGHRTPRMLMRYTHLVAEEVGERLRSLESHAAMADKTDQPRLTPLPRTTILPPPVRLDPPKR